MKIDYSDEQLCCYGVYYIMNNITKDIYIGSTIKNFKSRISQHKTFYNKHKNGIYKRSVNPKLFEAFDEFGFDNFSFFIIKCFTTFRNKERKIRIIRRLEERYISIKKPLYNICIKPTLSGCPNLGRKLTQKWKDNIGAKSKMYKHSIETLDKISKNNKDNSSIYKIYFKNGNIFEDNYKNCCILLDINGFEFSNCYLDKISIRGVEKIEKIRKQSKGIKIFKDNVEHFFNSYGECDRFLNMYRGYTSTQVVRNNKKILDFEYELIGNDIVYST